MLKSSTFSPLCRTFVAVINLIRNLLAYVYKLGKSVNELTVLSQLPRVVPGVEVLFSELVCIVRIQNSTVS